MKHFCVNNLCPCYVEVSDDVRAITFESKEHAAHPTTFTRVIIGEVGKPPLTVCSMCANILRIVHEN